MLAALWAVPGRFSSLASIYPPAVLAPVCGPCGAWGGLPGVGLGAPSAVSAYLHTGYFLQIRQRFDVWPWCRVFFVHTARGLPLGPVWGFPPPLRGLVWVAPRSSVPCRSGRRWRPGLGRFARCAALWSAWPGAGSPPPMARYIRVAGKGRPGPGFPWC